MIASRIGAACRAIAPAVGAVFEFLVLLAGAGGVSYGAWLAYQPAGFVTGGSLLIAGTILRARGS